MWLSRHKLLDMICLSLKTFGMMAVLYNLYFIRIHSFPGTGRQSLFRMVKINSEQRAPSVQFR